MASPRWRVAREPSDEDKGSNISRVYYDGDPDVNLIFNLQDDAAIGSPMALA